MDVILIGLALSIVGVMVTVLLFAAVARPPVEDASSSEPKPSALSAGTFWASDEEIPGGSETQAKNPLSAIEDHLRSEIRTARAFLNGPTPESLHAPSDSPLNH